MFWASEKVLNKLKASKLQVVTGHVNTDLDAKLKEALEKYWDFCPVEFVDKGSVDNDRPALVLGDYEINSWTHYTYSDIGFINSMWISYLNHFDNLTVKNQCIGIDKTDEEIKNKIELAVLTLSGHAKFLYNSYKENKKLKGWKGNTEQLKTTTILIPTEYLSNGLTKNAFKKIPKHEFLPLKDIVKKLNSDKKEGYGVLLANKTVAGSTLEIFSLSTGEFIYYYPFGTAFAKGMVGTPDRITDKEIIEGIEKIEK
jgi:hypothetical protein